MRRNRPFRLGARLGTLGAVGLTCLVGIVGSLFVLGPHVDYPGPTLNDTSRLRQIVGLMYGKSFSYPMKDGAFDPYEFVRRGDIPREKYDVFRSERTGMGPTDEEIERGDYTNFPWERRRGDFDREPEALPVLLLWERVPDKRGGRVVAFSEGSAVYLDAEQFDAVLRRER